MYRTKNQAKSELSELGRTHVYIFFEHPVEMFCVVVTHHLGNFVYFKAGGFQQFLCFLEADAGQIVRKGLSGLMGETVCQVFFTESHVFGYASKRQI